MAQEPKRRHSKARKRTRRASIMLKSAELITCSNCQESTLPHIVCKNCGFYKGVKIKDLQKVTVTKA